MIEYLAESTKFKGKGICDQLLQAFIKFVGGDMEQGHTVNLTVIEVKGQVTVIDAEGNLRQLQENGKLFLNDHLITSPVSTIKVQYGDGHIVEIEANRLITINEYPDTREVFLTILESQENSGFDDENTIDDIQNLIAQGADPASLLEATAAGPGGTATPPLLSLGSSSFVVVSQNVIAQSEVEAGEASSVLDTSATDFGTDITTPANNPVDDSINVNLPITALTDTNVFANVLGTDAVSGQNVGITAFANDLSPGSTITYSLANNPQGLFAIDAQTGVVTLQADTAGLTPQDFDLQIQASSSDGSTFTQSVTVSLIDDIDSDNDGVVNSLDLDDDNDGVLDTVEDTLTVERVIKTLDSAAEWQAAGVTVTGEGSDLVHVGNTLNVTSDPGAHQGIGFNRGNTSELNTPTTAVVSIPVGDSTQTQQLKIELTVAKIWANFSAIANGSNAAALFELVDASGNVIDDYDWSAQYQQNNAYSDTDTRNDEVITLAGSGQGLFVRVTDVESDSHVASFNDDWIIDSLKVTETLQTNDADGDGIVNSLDTDSDNDGISDAIEAQSSGSFVAPGEFVDVNGDGLNDNITSASVLPEDSDGDGVLDLVDNDSDNDGSPDKVESGLAANHQATLTDTPDDLTASGDGLTFRNAAETVIDSDNDGVPDDIDIDDDNDGILDINEDANLTVQPSLVVYDSTQDWIDLGVTVSGPGSGVQVGGGYSDSLQGIHFNSGEAAFNDASNQTQVTIPVPDFSERGTVTSIGVILDVVKNWSNSYGGQLPSAEFELIDSEGNVVSSHTQVLNKATTTDVNDDSQIPPENLYQILFPIPGDGAGYSIRITDTSADGAGAWNNDWFVNKVSFTVNSAEPYVTPDADGDGIINSLDTDSDNDGILDVDEVRANPTEEPVAFVDADGDGLNDAYDADTASTDAQLSAGLTPADLDNNGIADYLEETLDSDGDGVADVHDIDDDNDGILDSVENLQVVNTDQSFSVNVLDAEAWQDLDIASDTSDNLRIDDSGLIIPNIDSVSGNSDPVELTIAGPGITDDITVTVPFIHFSVDTSNADPDETLTFELLDADNNVLVTQSVTGQQVTGIGDEAAVSLVISATTTDVSVRITSDAVGNSGTSAWTITQAVFTYGFGTPDIDGDGIINSLDKNSDAHDVNDPGNSYTDNIEAQASGSFIASTDFVDIDGDGLHDAYDADTTSVSAADSKGLTPVNSDSASAPDFANSSADNNSDPQLSTPLILDLDGDGVETLSREAGVQFDINADGKTDTTGWAGADDALLVRDINQDGVINDATELFGQETLLSNGEKAADGFQALSDLDSNQDGIFDFNDKGFDELRLWQDANSDGVSQQHELISLADAGVASINLHAYGVSETNAGNEIGLRSEWTDTSGKQHAVDDVWFSFVSDTSAHLDEMLHDACGCDVQEALDNLHTSQPEAVVNQQQAAANAPQYTETLSRMMEDQDLIA